MKITLLILLVLFVSNRAYSQAQSDTLNNCCDKKDEALNMKSEDGTPASFPGGQGGWYRWLSKRRHSKEKQLQESKIHGKCHFEFLIDTSGKVTDLKFCSMQGTLAETVIRDILDIAPVWRPAFSYKRGKVVQSFCQTLTFGFGESEE